MKELRRMRRCQCRVPAFVFTGGKRGEGQLPSCSGPLFSSAHSLLKVSLSPISRQGTSLAVRDNPLEPLLDVLSRFVDEVGLKNGMGLMMYGKQICFRWGIRKINGKSGAIPAPPNAGARAHGVRSIRFPTSHALEISTKSL